jgi:osmotically-inducible protein OsmY
LIDAKALEKTAMPHCHFCAKFLVALICATSIDAVPQSEIPPDVTRYTYPLPGTPGAEISDEALEAAVTRELDHDPIIDTDTIEVEATNHVIRLTGTQPLLIARERATYVAETVRGVLQVINEIEVDAGREVDGRRLESDILYALLTDPATERREFTVEASDTGDVVLGGVVESGAERAVAEKIVMSIAGVRSVDNNVELVRAQQRPDREIYADVMRMLQWDAYVDSGGIEVSVDDGIVTLAGIVSTPAEKRRAVGLSWVAGVKHVNIVPLLVSAQKQGRRDRPVARLPTDGVQLELRSDNAIADAVRRALALDPRVAAEKIDVRVEDRVVTLSGTVRTLRAKRITADKPYGILGVKSVRDQLRLPQARMYDDGEIRLRVQRSLERNSLLGDDRIVVLVRDGIVTLKGTTDSRYERALAGNIAAAIRSVSGIQNEIDVAQEVERFSYDPYVEAESGTGLPWEYPTPHARDKAGDDTSTTEHPIANSVRSELWWSPFVSEDDITVSVRSAVVTLKGTVDSEAERRAAIENAFEGGAVSVKSELVVAD